MRKEIIGISLFFLVILTLISLLSYSPADPSINHATSSDHIHNFFGLLGAQLAGLGMLHTWGCLTARPESARTTRCSPAICHADGGLRAAGYNHRKSAGNT